MPGDFDSTRVSGLNRGGKLSAGNVHVSLKGSHAFVHPVIDRADGVIGIREFVQLGCKRSRAFEIRSSDVKLWAGDLVSIDELFESEIGVGFEAAGGAKRGDPASKIQTRETEAHFTVKRRSAGNGALSRRCWIEEVVVHADQTGNDGATGEIDCLGTRWDGSALADFPDGAIFDEHGLVDERGRAGAIDHADMLESDERRVHGDEAF